MISGQSLLFIVAALFAINKNVLGAPFSNISETTKNATISLPSTLAAANRELVIRPLSDAAVNDTVEKHKAEIEGLDSEWQQNALGKWEWKGKRTTKSSLTVASSSKAEVQSTVKTTPSSSTKPVAQIQEKNSSNKQEEIKEKTEKIEKATVTAASSTLASTVSSSTIASTSTSSSAAITAHAIVSNLTETNKSKAEEVIGQRSAVVLPVLADAQNATSAAPKATIQSSTSTSATTLQTTASTTLASTQSSSAATKESSPSSSSTLASTQSSSLSTEGKSATTLNSSFFPATEKSSDSKTLEKSEVKTNETVPSGSTVYNSLSELAGAGLKVGERLEVSSVDSKTNTIILSIKSDNVSLTSTESTTAKFSQVDSTSTVASSSIKTESVMVNEVPNVPKKTEDKPESHLLIPLIPVGKPSDKGTIWSGSVSDMNPVQVKGPQPEPGRPHENASPKKSAGAKNPTDLKHWSGSVSDLNPVKVEGPQPEPGRPHENAPPKKSAGAKEPNDQKHWSGSASDMSPSQYRGPKPEGVDGKGKSHGKLPTQEYGAPVSIVGYDKVPYLWDSIMQGVLGMMSSASSYVAPVLESDQTSGILSSIPSFDLGSLQSAKDVSKSMEKKPMKHASSG